MTTPPSLRSSLLPIHLTTRVTLIRSCASRFNIPNLTNWCPLTLQVQMYAECWKHAWMTMLACISNSLNNNCINIYRCRTVGNWMSTTTRFFGCVVIITLLDTPSFPIFPAVVWLRLRCGKLLTHRRCILSVHSCLNWKQFRHRHISSTFSLTKARPRVKFNVGRGCVCVCVCVCVLCWVNLSQH